MTAFVVEEALVGELGADGPEIRTGAVVVDPIVTAAGAVAAVVQRPAVGVLVVGTTFENNVGDGVTIVQRDAVGVAGRGEVDIGVPGAVDAQAVRVEVESDGVVSVDVVGGVVVKAMIVGAHGPRNTSNGA